MGAHKSVNFVNRDIVEGIGPSMDEPCISLQQFNMFIDKETKYKRNLYEILRVGKIRKINGMECNTYSLTSLVQFPIKSGIFPENAFPSNRLQAVY